MEHFTPNLAMVLCPTNFAPFLRSPSTPSSPSTLNSASSATRFGARIGTRGWRGYRPAAVLPGDSVAALVVANGVSNFLNFMICDPYLNIFRGLIPPLGGTLDLSPILAFLVLNAFTSTASALPAELPGSSPVVASRGLGATHFTTLQKKWIARLQGSSSNNNTKC